MIWELGIAMVLGLSALGASSGQSPNQMGAEEGVRARPSSKVSVLEPLGEVSTIRIEEPATWSEVKNIALPAVDRQIANVRSSPTVSSRPGKELEAALEIRHLVRGWARAWSWQDVGAYLSYYAFDFRPGEGLSREAWEALREQRLRRPEFIRVEVDILETPKEISPGRFRVEIRQSYEADHYSDVVRKTLDVVREGFIWKILREEQRALL